MKYIAYLKEDCYKPAELFVWKGIFGTNEQYDAFEDDTNWRETSMIAPFLGVYDWTQSLDALREKISNNTGFSSRIICLREVKDGIMNVTVDMCYLRSWKLLTGMQKRLDGFVLYDFEFGPINAVADRFDCDKTVFELIITPSKNERLPRINDEPRQLII